ncbi:hypothetical protein [Pyrinomonas methylaliphatogenes]
MSASSTRRRKWHGTENGHPRAKAVERKAARPKRATRAHGPERLPK